MVSQLKGKKDRCVGSRRTRDASRSIPMRAKTSPPSSQRMGLVANSIDRQLIRLSPDHVELFANRRACNSRSHRDKPWSWYVRRANWRSTSGSDRPATTSQRFGGADQFDACEPCARGRGGPARSPGAPHRSAPASGSSGGRNSGSDARGARRRLRGIVGSSVAGSGPGTHRLTESLL